MDEQALEIKRAFVHVMITKMDELKITRSDLARLMETSGSQVRRILDPEEPNIRLATLRKAARAVGIEANFRIVPKTDP